ncbi:7634_t:CDS:2, partial [Cetraspora pellucida]
VVERDFALQNESMKITNTLYYCADYLKGCSYFATKHSSEQIQNIINLAMFSISKKHVAVSYAEDDNNDSAILTTSTHSTNLLFVSNDILSSLKNKQHYHNMLTLVTKNDAALDDDLKLSPKIKVVVNHDSFWNSLAILSFEEADDDDINKDISLEANWNAFEEQDNLNNIAIDFLNLETHSAENQAA